MPEQRPPKVTIGLPVYNGERFLARALDSHLAQTFQDFELIISDNASTDGTRKICEDYAARDPRIHYHCVDENRGAMWNFNRCLELARGEYFKWSAHDDIIEPTFLERCVEALDADASLALCHSRAKVVDEHMTVIGLYDPGALKTDSPSASTRFGARITGRTCIEIFGLMRTRMIRNNPRGPFQSFVGADRAVLAELAVDGRFACVPEYLFLNGEHLGRSTSPKGPLDRLSFYTPVRKGARSFPIWSLFGAYADIVHRRFTSFGDRCRCYGHMGRALFTRFNIVKMMLEPLSAFVPGVYQAAAGAQRALGLDGYRNVRRSSPIRMK
ncbi:MAG: glycosyltransferase family 2 protein [Geminicoccaceae bacterium]|nr:glycosyltransferase family 2 protein [Geminicoccaceae bacterium]